MNNDSSLQNSEVFKHLDIPSLVLHSNLLIEHKILFNEIFDENKNISIRKKEIKSIMINFYIKTLNNINSLLYLIQNLQDYFVKYIINTNNIN